MKQVMGVINLINEWEELEDLTQGRPLSSVPFAGRYRLIDFILSSMVNSRIYNIGVFAHTKFRSLMDHIGTGKDWDLARKRTGLYLLPPAGEEKQEIMKGDLYHFYNHRDFFHRASQQYVIIARGHMVCNIDLKAVVRHHMESGTDITMVYKEAPDVRISRVRRLQTDDSGRITDIQDYFGTMDSNKVSMEIFLMKKELLLDLVATTLAQGYDHFVRNAIMNNRERLHITGYAYDGYLGVVNTLPSYFQCSMDMLDPRIWKQLFFEKGSLIYTKVKDEPPSRYTHESRVRNALVANGCRIEGTVENSILFRGVQVHKEAVVRNSIVMQNGRIHSGARLENVILDKDVTIREGVGLQGHASAPFLAGKRKEI